MALRLLLCGLLLFGDVGALHFRCSIAFAADDVWGTEEAWTTCETSTGSPRGGAGRTLSARWFPGV